MKKRISFIIVILLTILCSYFLVWNSFDIYRGIGFSIIDIEMIFTALSFISLSILMKNRDDCLFDNQNLIRLTRIGSKSKALAKELCKTAIIVLIIEGTEILSVAVFSLIFNKSAGIKDILLMFILGYIVKLFLMIIQFIIEIFYYNDLSFVFISVAFLLLLAGGGAMHKFIIESPQAAITPYLKIINKIDIVNYISLDRATELADKTIYPVIIITGVILIQTVFCFIKVKKLNILPKE